MEKLVRFYRDRIHETFRDEQQCSIYVRLKDSTNIIAPHVPMNGKLKELDVTKTNLDAAAGNLFKCQ
jgi:hypothetical protein